MVRLTGRPNVRVVLGRLCANRPEAAAWDGRYVHGMQSRDPLSLMWNRRPSRLHKGLHSERMCGRVDVRDVARAHVLAAETSAANGPLA